MVLHVTVHRFYGLPVYVDYITELKLSDCLMSIKMMTIQTQDEHY